MACALQRMPCMNDLSPTPNPTPESGKVGWAIAWLLGVPLPILLVVYLISRC